MEMWLAPALGDIQILEAYFNCRLAAHRRTAHDRATFAQLRCQLQARIAHRVARRDDRELREAVDIIFLARLEMFRGVETPHLCAVLETQGQLVEINSDERRDARTALAHSTPVLSEAYTETRNNPDSRDCDAAGRHLSAAPAVCAGSL